MKPSIAFTEMEMGVLCAIAYHQPIDRAGLKDIFGEEVSRDLLAWLRSKDLIASGPRSLRPGGAHTFVTTETFLVTFDLQTLRDLPELIEMESLADSILKAFEISTMIYIGDTSIRKH